MKKTITRKYAKSVNEHYCRQAKDLGLSSLSTIHDPIIRTRELHLIRQVLKAIVRAYHDGQSISVIDLGCGNGYTLTSVADECKKGRLSGIDANRAMIRLAKSRKSRACSFYCRDVCNLGFPDNSADFIYTERCIINLLSWKDQMKAIREVHRLLKPGAYFLMIECFTDGHDAYNKARGELGLEKVPPASHNLYLKKSLLRRALKNRFEYIQLKDFCAASGDSFLTEHFLSSHYFISRVLYPALHNGEWKRANELVNFFSFLPPVGNYSPLQAILLRKI